MTIFKAQWDADGDNLRLSMPFSKVDVEKRIVSGFATLDNVDKQSDIITSDASVKAFSKFRGNIREMHQPISVGKMVNFKEEKYFDPETKKFYSGVYVSAYISKGAQDTWEKVLDGTLSGFSIGGKMNKYEDAYDAKSDRQIRVIKEYDLHELSLVDNPANQFANIMSIEKVDGVDVVKGDILNVDIENVFWDEESGIITVSKEESAISPISNLPMKNIGFVETNDSEKTEMIKFLVDSAKGINTEMIKEASPMSKTTDTIVEKSEEVVEETQVAPEADAVVEEVATEEVAEETTVVEEDVEESDVTTEEVAVEAVAEEVSKSDEMIEAIAEINSNLKSAFSDLSAVVKSLQEEIAEVKKSANLANAKLADAEKDFNEFGKRIDAVEHDTAIRKSGDLGEIVQEQPEKVEKSLWGGRFLKTADLFR